MTTYVTRRGFNASVMALLAASAFCSSAFAQDAELKIGMASPITSLDPHEDSNSPNNATSRHIWDSLINRGGAAENKPQLATDWEVVDDTHWRFTLREGVKFHDGSAFDSEDVVASLIRARDKESQAFASYTRTIKSVTAEDDHTVVVETSVPDPLILNSLSRIRIISSDENGGAKVGHGSGGIIRSRAA